LSLDGLDTLKTFLGNPWTIRIYRVLVTATCGVIGWAALQIGAIEQRTAESEIFRVSITAIAEDLGKDIAATQIDIDTVDRRTRRIEQSVARIEGAIDTMRPMMSTGSVPGR
jgi:hypothetical protein